MDNKTSTDESFASLHKSMVNDIENTFHSLKYIKSNMKELDRLYLVQMKKVNSYEKQKNKKALKSKIRKASPVPKDICQMLGLTNDVLLPRTEITKKIYDYIKTNNLQDESDKRIIKPNDELKKIFNLSDGEEVSFLNIQTYIKKAYSSGTGQENQEDVENQENLATV
jgi:chromatin remodeling complex protein RSC6